MENYEIYLQIKNDYDQNDFISTCKLIKLCDEDLIDTLDNFYYVGVIQLSLLR